MTKEEFITLLQATEVGQAVDELNRLVDENPYFHTGHQLYIKSLQQTDVEKMEFQLNRTALMVRDRGVLFNYLSGFNAVSGVKGVTEEEVEEKISSPANLIDSFLKADAKITPNPNREADYQVDLSESNNECDDFSTETLADIYATQGYKNKAIEIYEQLILKNPEKHIYFAAQIKRLKE